MKKWLVKIFIFISGVYVFSFLVMTGLYFQNRLQMQGDVKFNAARHLSGKVTIMRDQYGVAHIRTEKSEQAAFFALGYAHAQDRLWQMEFNRRVAQGTLSEVLGEKTLKADEYLRTWGFYRSAQTAWKGLSIKTQNILQAYAGGVNGYLSENPLPLPFLILQYKPRPWTVIDSLACQKILAWDLQNVWQAKFKNYVVQKNLGADHISVIFPPYPAQAPAILSDADLQQSGLQDKSLKSISSESSTVISADKGSNNWVISGKWTQSGKPLLANDPHLELQSPSLWYLAEIAAPGLHVTGATLPGMPGVIIGHNDHVAWGVTNVNPDVQDLYILNAHSDIKQFREIINIKSKPSVIFLRRESRGRPIISQVTEAGRISPDIALAWTGFDPHDTTVQSMLALNYAKNWTEFAAALKYFVTPSQNFVYADTDGNIGYYLPGKIPLRSWDSRLPVPDDKFHQWLGYIPFEKLPHVYNPPEGFIVTANNRPAGNHYPYALNFRWAAPPYRAERIIKRLKQNRPLTIEKLKHIQTDAGSELWPSLSPWLLNVQPLDKMGQTALNYLKNWNGEAGLDSIAQTIFAYWYHALGKRLMPDFMISDADYPEPLYIEQQLKYLNKQTLNNIFQTAVNQLISDRGVNPQNWAWGKAHTAVFNELGIGTVPVLGDFWNRRISTAGGLYAINVGTYHYQTASKTFEQNTGAVYRQLIDLNNMNNSFFIQTLGQSNNPLSPHYEDQLILWRDGKYLSMSGNPKEWGKTEVLTLH